MSKKKNSADKGAYEEIPLSAPNWVPGNPRISERLSFCVLLMLPCCLPPMIIHLFRVARPAR